MTIRHNNAYFTFPRKPHEIEPRQYHQERPVGTTTAAERIGCYVITDTERQALAEQSVGDGESGKQLIEAIESVELAKRSLFQCRRRKLASRLLKILE